MDRIKAINQKCKSLKSQITQLANCVASNRYDQVNLKMRLNRVTELLHAYEELNDELAIIDPTNERLEEIYEIQNRYYDVASKIESLEVAGTSTARINETLGSAILNTTVLEGRRTLKLPVAELPKFNGSLDKWLSYKNTFVTMIDERADISDLEKFIHLKNSLRGDALNKILVFDASAENYQNAWRLLVDSYEKRRILVSKHLDAILDITGPAKITSNGLAKIIDDVRQHLNTLQSLGITPDNALIIRILERALPDEIRQKWEESLSLDVLPTLDQFYKFVNETTFRLLTREQNAVREKTETGGKRRLDRESRAIKMRRGESGARTLVTGTTITCSYCKQRHTVFNCPALGRLTTAQRWEAVKNKKLCQNCLRTHTGQCRSSRCKHCGRLHHSMLHRFEAQSGSDGSTSTPAKATNETVDSKGPA